MIRRQKSYLCNAKGGALEVGAGLPGSRLKLFTADMAHFLCAPCRALGQCLPPCLEATSKCCSETFVTFTRWAEPCIEWCKKFFAQPFSICTFVSVAGGACALLAVLILLATSGFPTCTKPLSTFVLVAFLCFFISTAGTLFS